uniref:Jacalin-type lectin domain-containing protein n=1 Tax=Oryza punctata TaxID=4537 RepID=A0A0E0KN39_ORYPU
MALTLTRVKVGPWGGTGGSAWDEGGYDDTSGGGYTGIRSMSIGSSSWCVSSMLFVYDDNGRRVKGKLHGVKDFGTNVELDFPGEVLTHISGYHDSKLIRRLEFRTNRNRTLGPYGVNIIENEQWRQFEVSMEKAGSIVGFSGRSGNYNYIDAISIYIAVWNPDRFFNTLREQGIIAYQMPPIRLQLRKMEKLKNEQVERGHVKGNPEEGQEHLIRKLPSQTQDKPPLAKLEKEQQELSRRVQELEELYEETKQKVRDIQRQVEQKKERLRELKSSTMPRDVYQRQYLKENATLRSMEEHLKQLEWREQAMQQLLQKKQQELRHLKDQISETKRYEEDIKKKRALLEREQQDLLNEPQMIRKLKEQQQEVARQISLLEHLETLKQLRRRLEEQQKKKKKKGFIRRIFWL